MANNLYNTMYNPDVLSCIANLSNDEVFTPPEVANAMLDLLPQELFSDPNTTFLDPACKSGVFLREIAKRLLKGLEPLYPDLQERTDHIFKHQLYGIAITELTSHLSRRSLYCSKFANGRYRSRSSIPLMEMFGLKRSSIAGGMANAFFAEPLKANMAKQSVVMIWKPMPMNLFILPARRRYSR
jgi:hypothetical protein